MLCSKKNKLISADIHEWPTWGTGRTRSNPPDHLHQYLFAEELCHVELLLVRSGIRYTEDHIDRKRAALGAVPIQSWSWWRSAPLGAAQRSCTAPRHACFRAESDSWGWYSNCSDPSRLPPRTDWPKCRSLRLLCTPAESWSPVTTARARALTSVRLGNRSRSDLFSYCCRPDAQLLRQIFSRLLVGMFLWG